MFRAFFASFCLVLTVLLSACGSGDSASASGATAPGTPPASAAVSSNVVKGLIHNGVVHLLRRQAGVYVTVATALTAADGSFQINVPDPVPGEVLKLKLVLSTDAAKPTKMLCDAVVCGSTPFREWAPLTSAPGLVSWVSIDAAGVATVMPMTPISTLLVHYAEQVGGGAMDAASLALARQQIAALFHLSSADLLVRPGNVANDVWLNAASPAAVKLSLLAAAFAQLADTQSLDHSHALKSVIADYAAAFVDNNGQLMQDGASHSLGDIYRALKQVLIAAGNPSLQGGVSDWPDEALAALEYGKLSTTVCSSGAVPALLAEPCVPFNSNRFLTALGTSTDSLGGDLRRVMQEQNVQSLEQLLAQELSKMGWVASSDSLAVAKIALQAVGYTLSGSLGVAPVAVNGLTPVLDAEKKTLRITGEQNGMTVDLTITLTSLIAAVQSTKVFNFGAVGTVSNANITASIDGTLSIDAAGTDFTPLLLAFAGASSDPKALQKALSGILKTGKASFTLKGSAGLAKKNSTSKLAIEGLGSLVVNMQGGAGGAISASGSAHHGRVILPNGTEFSIDPLKGELLTFSLGQDGDFSAKFSTLMLAHAANVSATGKLAQLGTLLTNLRNSITTQLVADVPALSGVVNQLLTDLSSLRLLLDGKASIPDFAHVYSLSYADGHLRITQPNSTATALEMSFSLSGILVQAGGEWWMVRLDLSVPGDPAVLLTDDTGGSWRWSFAALASPPDSCFGALKFC